MGDGVVAALPRPGNVVLDIDGCLTTGGRAIPGATATLDALDRDGISWLIATNNSTRTSESVSRHLGEVLGRAIDAAHILTSAQAVAGLLGPEDSPAVVVGESGLTVALAARGIAITRDAAAARSVVVGLDRSFDFALLQLAGRAAGAGARLVASNADPTFPHPDGPLPGAGALLAAVEAMAGRRAEVAGKPNEPMRRLITSRLTPGPTWMVGDRAATDLALARTAGWCGVLVLTGVERNAESIPPEWKPDLVLQSVAELPKAIAASLSANS